MKCTKIFTKLTQLYIEQVSKFLAHFVNEIVPLNELYV